MALKGNLHDFSITQLLNLIHLARKTGTLAIESRNNAARFFRIQLEDSGYIVRIGKLLDGSPGGRYFDCSRHSQGDAINKFDFVNDGDRTE